MVTFVLVHGSFHGGWCWSKVERRLRSEGHDVYTPTLTGLGDRSHLVHPRVGLGLHVNDVVQAIEYRDLREFVLVGHSYGGLVITGVAEACGERIDQLVYLDGFLPEHGQSAWDIIDSKDRWDELAEPGCDGWLVPPPDPVERYGVSDPNDASWLRENLVPTPLRTHEERLDAPADRAKDLPRAYIACTRYETFAHVAEKARAEDLAYHELRTGHDAMVTMPAELTTLLLTIGTSGGNHGP